MIAAMDEVDLDDVSLGQSPKVSTTGTFEDASQKNEHSQQAAQASLQGRSLHDHHHWSDVPRFPGEKSVTSSVGVERDESIADAVEVEEVTEEQQADEETPTEIVLAQVREHANGLPVVGSERSTAESSASRPISKQGSLVAAEASGVDLLAERITEGDLSPSQAAEALSALALGRGNSSASAGGGGGKSADFGPPSAGRSQAEEEAEGWGGGESADLEDVMLSEDGQPPQLQAQRDFAGAPPGAPEGSSSQEPAAAVAAPEPTGGNPFDEVNYQARLVQQLTTSEEDDLTVYRSTDMAAAAQAAQSLLRNPSAGLAAAAAAQAAAAAGPAGPAASTQAAAATGGRTKPMERFEIDAGQEGGSGGPSAAAAAPVQEEDDIWERTFKGLVYVDGVDALGRPVVVVDADAVPPNMKSSALVYCKMHLEPVVNKGHYVLVFTAKKATLPTMWILGAYRTLSRPFRKNVQWIILVRPSGFLRAVLAFMRSIVSKKAGRKIRTVESLQEIGEATGGEVTLQHLGARFNANLEALA